MENPQENNKTESFGFKPNWGMVIMISLLVFFGAFLGGLMASYMGSGIITKKIKAFLEEKQEATKQDLNKPKGKIVKLEEAELTDEEEAEGILAHHKKFREKTFPKPSDTEE